MFISSVLIYSSQALIFSRVGRFLDPSRFILFIGFVLVSYYSFHSIHSIMGHCVCSGVATPGMEGTSL